MQNAIANQNKVSSGTYNLNIKDGNWEKVMKFVVSNKSKGLGWIISTLKTKYTITKEVEKEISNHVK